MKIIQWGAGNVGRHSLRGILERPELELVGLRVYSPEKLGVDAGVLLGGEPVGVISTDDTSEILALEADCVLYNALGTTLVDLDQPVQDIAALLASGKNVIASSIDLFLNIRPGVAPKFLTPSLISTLEGACRVGNSTLYAAGMTPGFALDLWPITMSRVCRAINSVSITEVVDMRDYKSEMMAFMGFGLAPEADVPMHALFEDTENSPYAAALSLVAEALGVTLSGITYEREVATAPERITLASGVYEPGTVVATKFSIIGQVDGSPFISITYVWRASNDVEPTWPIGHCRWIVDIRGEPDLVSEMQLSTNVDAKRPTSLTVAMHGLNSIPAVCAAPAGIASHLTLPVFGGRAQSTLRQTPALAS
jgi:4-hydroxy-tetrahydrodipicolinate reductase